jgi:xylose isomerase
MNRGDAQLGWDTDQFPNNLPELALAMYHIVKAGGLGSGGLNFDAKVRRQSLDPEDMFHGHVGAMDLCAQALLAAERIVADGELDRLLESRYQGWAAPRGQDILAGRIPLQDLAEAALERNKDAAPVSGRQEYLENLINRIVAA